DRPAAGLDRGGEPPRGRVPAPAADAARAVGRAPAGRNARQRAAARRRARGGGRRRGGRGGHYHRSRHGDGAMTATTNGGPTGNHLIEVRDLVKHFPLTKGIIFRKQIGAVQAVDGVSFDVVEGETLGLVGESGCGKST